MLFHRRGLVWLGSAARYINGQDKFQADDINLKFNLFGLFRHFYAHITKTAHAIYRDFFQK